MTVPESVAAVCARIDDAQDYGALIGAVQSAREVVDGLIRDRTPVLRAAASWSQIVRTSVVAAVSFGVPASRSDWLWYVSGSTARDEALPGSDVETLLAVGDESDLPAAAAHAASVHAVLERCGIAADDKGAIASRTRFCRTTAHWHEGIHSWTADPAADRGVVMAGLLADARSLDGADDLRLDLGNAIRRSDRGLPAMLDDSLSSRAHVPSRLRLLAPRDDRVDIKSAVLQPIVSIARWAALSCGSTALPTIDRVADAAGSPFLDTDDAKVLRECYTIATRIRFQHRSDDDLTMSALAPHDRALVRGVGRELNGIRRKLNYLASTSSFSRR